MTKMKDHCFVFIDNIGIVQDVVGPDTYEVCCEYLVDRLKRESDAKGFDEVKVRLEGNFLFPDNSCFSICSISPMKP